MIYTFTYSDRWNSDCVPTTTCHPHWVLGHNRAHVLPTMNFPILTPAGNISENTDGSEYDYVKLLKLPGYHVMSVRPVVST